MRTIFKAFFIGGASLLVVGCDSKPQTLQDYLEHPYALEKQLEYCLNSKSLAATEVAQCKIADEAQVKVRGYLQEMQSDPEGFGQKILTAQMTYATCIAKAITPQTQQKCIETGNEIKALLAVAGLSSPD